MHINGKAKLKQNICILIFQIILTIWQIPRIYSKAFLT